MNIASQHLVNLVAVIPIDASFLPLAAFLTVILLAWLDCGGRSPRNDHRQHH